MNNKANKDNKFKLIVCIILSLSVFTAHLPFDTGGGLFLIMTFIQIILPIIFAFIIREFKNFCICTGSLAVSNIVSSVYTWIWVQAEIEEIHALKINNFAPVFAIASFGLLAYISIGVTIFVCSECAVSLFIRNKEYKKLKINRQQNKS